jgi:hypothetical protein
MGLLNPLLLALGLAAAVPLLLHLLQRHQGPRVVFPALRYLRRAEKESARRIRVRQILLMLLRVAAVLLVALAAARPFMRLAGSAHAPTAVAIILDNSMSSSVVEQDARLLDRLKDRALEVLADAGPDDRFWLFRAGAPEEPALAGDAETTALRIRETGPSIGGANLPVVLGRARNILAAGAEGRAVEIHLLSDLQVSSFPSILRADDTTPPVVVWHPGTEPPPNRGVTAVEVGGGMSPIQGQRTTVGATISGSGEDPVNVRLMVAGRLTAAAAAQPCATAVLSLQPQPGGLLSGRVEIDADALSADNTRYFVTRVLPPPSVGLSGELPFVHDAVEVLAAAGRVRRAGVAAADVVIAGGGEAIQAARRAVVVLPPEQAVELTAVNGRLAAAGIPWRFGAPEAGEARFATDARDPLLRSLADIRLRQVYPLRPVDTSPADTVLLRLADGAPWAVRGERRTGGNYVVIGSPLSPEASTLPVSAAMLPLLDRLTGPWTMAEPPQHDIEPGAELRVPTGVSRLERPDGSSEAVVAGASHRVGSEPGVYRLLRDDSVISAFAVNPAAASTDLTRMDRDGLEARLPGWQLHVTTDPGAWRRAAFRERLGREMWRTVMMIVLILLIVEMIVAASGRSRRHAADTTGAPEAATT